MQAYFFRANLLYISISSMSDKSFKDSSSILGKRPMDVSVPPQQPSPHAPHNQFSASSAAFPTSSAALGHYERFCRQRLGPEFQSIYDIDKKYYLDNAWWEQVATYFVELRRFKPDTILQYFSTCKEFQKSRCPGDQFWQGFEAKSYARIRRSKLVYPSYKSINIPSSSPPFLPFSYELNHD